MKSRTNGVLAAIIAGSLIVGCAAQTVAPPLPPEPLLSLETVKRAIVRHRARLFKDADSIRDSAITQPFVCPAGRGTCVCLELNARNSFGGYTGIKPRMVHFRVDDNPEIFGDDLGGFHQKYCSGYTPFPEMNAKK